MREFNAEEFAMAADALQAKPHQNPNEDKIIKDAVETFLADRIPVLTLMMRVSPEATIGAAILYGMDLARKIEDIISCEPGDFHCLEHHTKNCECTCETTSQVGKDEEILNPAGPRYF